QPGAAGYADAKNNFQGANFGCALPSFEKLLCGDQELGYRIIENEFQFVALQHYVQGNGDRSETDHSIIGSDELRSIRKKETNSISLLDVIARLQSRT